LQFVVQVAGPPLGEHNAVPPGHEQVQVERLVC
jgi:hypothetical protein